MSITQIILTIWFVLLAGVFVTFILIKMLNAGKTNVVILNPDRTYATGQFKTDGNKLKIKEGYTPNFKTEDIFEERKPGIKFWRNPKRILFMVANANKTVSWKTGESGELKPTDLWYNWTPKEIQVFVNKLAKKAAVATRPMSQTMFIILAIIGVISILIQIYSMTGGNF
jgi:hypothetical protein